MIRLLVAALLTAVVATAPAFADTPATLDKINSSGEILLGYRESAPPFSSVDEATGIPAGYSIDLCLKIADAIKAKLGRLRPHRPLRSGYGRESLSEGGRRQHRPRMRNVDHYARPPGSGRLHQHDLYYRRHPARSRQGNGEGDGRSRREEDRGRRRHDDRSRSESWKVGGRAQRQDRKIWGLRRGTEGA